MKCDELKQVENPIEWGLYYNKSEVDAAIAELKAQVNGFENRANLWLYNAQNEHNAAVAVRMENKKLKQKLQDQCISCPVKMQEDDVVAEFKEKLEDAGMRERRLRRALYKACANWADVVAFEETEGIGYENSVAERWRKMESKCRAKAEANK